MTHPYSEHRPDIGPCEHVEPTQEKASPSAQGLLVCEHCRDFVGVIVERSPAGDTRVAALHCLNCGETVPVRKGFVVWRPPFFFRLRYRLSRLLSPVAS